MGARTKAIIGALALAAVGLGAMIGMGLARDPAPASASAIADWETARPAMERLDPAVTVPAAGRLPNGGKPQKGKRTRQPQITDLITTSPVTVDANSARIAVLSCGKSEGIALDGGVITPAAPAQVVVSVLSRANPNPPFANSRRNYYVGVRNLDAVPATFRGTLVCAKGISVK